MLWRFNSLKINNIFCILILARPFIKGASVDFRNTPVPGYLFITVRFYMLIICRSLDRESNPRPLAYGNTASIEGTTTLTTRLSQIPFLQYANTFYTNNGTRMLICIGHRTPRYSCGISALAPWMMGQSKA
jgi:hypothetical protein